MKKSKSPIVLFMKQLLKLFQVVYTIYALLIFVIFLLIIIPLVVIASFFGKTKGGNYIYKLYSLWAIVWFFFIGFRPKVIYDAPHHKTNQYIFVCNHRSYMDVPALVWALRQPFRALGKYELSKLPVFGFLYKNTVVMVNRSSAANRAKSVATLKKVLQKGISVVIYPEGTFNTTTAPLKDFYEGAFRIAIETQTPIKPILFPDTLNRLHYKSVWSLNPGKCRSIFLQEISVEGLTMNDIGILKEKVYKLMEEGLLKYINKP